ncbi:periplasmic/secreted protein [Actinobacillus ureae]|nr:periplasmic/secreted protein [Actinobacillus ureae]SUU50048.1 periplasmic/secreted protein [Actinobacillus ureae]
MGLFEQTNPNRRRYGLAVSSSVSSLALFQHS